MEKIKEFSAIPELVEDAMALAVARGVVMYPAPKNKREATVVPVTLLPCPLADDCFHLAKKPDFHLLMDRISCDLPWLQEALAKTGAMDEITCKLLDICTNVYNNGTGKDPKHDIRLHLMRNDFMLDMQKGSEGAMVQIELNMMSASFATHGQDLTEIHRYLLTKYLHRIDAGESAPEISEALSAALPTSSATEGMAEAMMLAHEAYTSRWQALGLPQAVLFIALEEEKNELDHRKLEIAAFKSHGLVALRPAEGAMVQIELNMMSASFATHGQDLTEIHRIT
eukprot:symbB.v1.2.011441.t1/scaffold762.1/size178242/2